MTAQVGYIDPILGKELTVEEVAAIATIQTCFYIDSAQQGVNRDCLNLWNTIQSWSEEGKEFTSFGDFIRTIKQQPGFSDTGLNEADVFDLNMYYADYIQFMDGMYCNFEAFL